MKVDLPYGKDTLEADIPDATLVDVVYPNMLEPEHSPEEYVRHALSYPMDTQSLAQLAEPGMSVAVAVDDNTRPCPTGEMLPHVIAELTGQGVSTDDITIIFATGTHRPVKHGEAEELLGADLANELTYLSNRCKKDSFSLVGTTSRDTDVHVNDAFLEADLQILLGDVEIHYFAGYGGGRKSILPGMCSYQTIQDNYTTNFFDVNARPGKLDGNPMYENMTEAARLTQPDFCLNVVQNARHQLVGAYAGDFDLVLRKGAALVDRMFKVEVPGKADVVVTAADGAPHDVNLYQAYKAIHLALNVVKPGGAIVLAARCSDGHGSQPYHDWMKRYDTKEEMQQELIQEFVPGGHKAYYHVKALEKADFYIVSDMDHEMLRDVFRMQVYDDINEAIEQALADQGSDASVLA
ncbi:MAG: nickel-dependent lactate racemase, partial [Candidatus Thermoplasmatota archaeon]|nr:nickel-dependent lactate racemase [Candidatus Thermoplasmatota archaeon]